MEIIQWKLGRPNEIFCTVVEIWKDNRKQYYQIKTMQIGKAGICIILKNEKFLKKSKWVPVVCLTWKYENIYNVSRKFGKLEKLFKNIVIINKIKFSQKKN